MARFYFDVDDNGSVYPDEEGTDCANLAIVKKEAISALVDMIRETLPDGDRHRLAIKVRDERGAVVLQVALNFEVEAEQRPNGPTPGHDT